MGIWNIFKPSATRKVASVGVIVYLIGSVLTPDPIGITLMFSAMFVFGGVVTMEMARRKKIIIEG